MLKIEGLEYCAVQPIFSLVQGIVQLDWTPGIRVLMIALPLIQFEY